MCVCSAQPIPINVNLSTTTHYSAEGKALCNFALGEGTLKDDKVRHHLSPQLPYSSHRPFRPHVRPPVLAEVSACGDQSGALFRFF